MDQPALPPSSASGAIEADVPLRAAEGLAEQLGHMLHVAAALIRQQRRVDLAGLDERIGRLCAAILDLPLEQGRRVRSRLQDLHDRLDTLASTLPPPIGASNMDAPS